MRPVRHAESAAGYAQIVDDLQLDHRRRSNTHWSVRRCTFDAAAENILRAMHTGLSGDVTPGRFAVEIHHASYLYIPRPSRGI